MRFITLLCLAVVIGLVSAGRGQRGGRGEGRGEGGGRGGRGGQREGQRRCGNRGACLLCRIDGIDGAEIDIPEGRRPNGTCPDESTCSVGPFRVMHMGTEAQLTFCDALDNDGNLKVFKRACRIELEDGTIIDRTGRGRRRCRSGDGNCCNKGPLTGYTYNGVAAEVYFSNHQGRRGPGFGNNRQNLEEVVDTVDGVDETF